MIEITENAAEQIKKEIQSAQAEGKALRLFVQPGGCSGFEYGMAFDDAQSDDSTHEMHGVKVIIDPQSAPYLNGCQIDFEGGLNGKGFGIKNPNAKSSCGCGKSFN